MHREFTEDFVCFGRKANQNLATVFSTAVATDEPSRRQAVNQFYCAVMLYLEALRHLGYARPCSFRKPFQGEQKLVLARLDSRGAGHLLAEMQETANLVPQFRQGLVIGHADYSAHAIMSFAPCMNIVSRHITRRKVLWPHEMNVCRQPTGSSIRVWFREPRRAPLLLRRVFAGDGFSHPDHRKSFAVGQGNVESRDLFVAVGEI
jgi:hypothetical protein